MPVLVKKNGSRKSADRIIVKVSGWVKLKKDGELDHYPPNEVKRIEEHDPDMKAGLDGEPTNHPDSNVIYQSPHGRV